MIEYIKRFFCRHGDMKIVSEREWVSIPGCTTISQDLRQYLICHKCGYKRKISKR